MPRRWLRATVRVEGAWKRPISEERTYELGLWALSSVLAKVEAENNNLRFRKVRELAVRREEKPHAFSSVAAAAMAPTRCTYSGCPGPPKHIVSAAKLKLHTPTLAPIFYPEAVCEARNQLPASPPTCFVQRFYIGFDTLRVRHHHKPRDVHKSAYSTNAS
jgi:hypothetical protein